MKREKDVEEYDHSEDPEFLADMKSRIDDYENGADKGLSWEEVKLTARNELRIKRQSLINKKNKQ